MIAIEKSSDFDSKSEIYPEKIHTFLSNTHTVINHTAQIKA